MTVATGTASSLLGGVTLTAGNVDTFTVALDPDTANEEIVFVTAVSGDTLTIVRGRSGTSGIAHAGGAKVKHVLVSADLDSYEATTNSAITATGTQTLTNKTIVFGSNTLTNVASTNTAQTLTNKTIDYNSNTITNLPASVSTLDLTINAQTGTTYTLALSDKNKLVTLNNASAVTLTLPPSGTAAFTAGMQIHIQQIGAGQVSIVQGSGVTITSTGNTSTAPLLRARYSAATIICTGTSTFTVIGDLA
jgi:hypothetical protein